MNLCHEKYEKLKDILKEMGNCVIAYSNGVDSTFLLATAAEVLGNQVAAVTLVSPVAPASDEREAVRFCMERGIRHELLQLDVLNIPGFKENPPDRCYICKKEIFKAICRFAREHAYAYVAEGSNQDDLGDYRPGMRALREMGIRSPLQEAGLTKDEIRTLSREMGLVTWSKPSAACLASRFPYGDYITEEKLHMVGSGEEKLRQMGFTQVRVRIHGSMARIECLPSEMNLLLDERKRTEIFLYMKELGFTYVTMDLQGFRSGSMNETLHLNR